MEHGRTLLDSKTQKKLGITNKTTNYHPRRSGLNINLYNKYDMVMIKRDLNPLLVEGRGGHNINIENFQQIVIKDIFHRRYHVHF